LASETNQGSEERWSSCALQMLCQSLCQRRLKMDPGRRVGSRVSFHATATALAATPNTRVQMTRSRAHPYRQFVGAIRCDVRNYSYHPLRGKGCTRLVVGMPGSRRAVSSRPGWPRGHLEPHPEAGQGRLNWLRAGVLGANDGIVSVAGIVVGVAGASTSRGAVFTAGLAGLVAGAVSMALGEYVSVSSQRDTERTLIRQESQELTDEPSDELEELTSLYEGEGLTEATAREVAEELTAHDALEAHMKEELHIDPHDLANPWQAAGASAVSFTVGAVLPLIAVLLPPIAWRVPTCIAAVLLALAITGVLSARLGGTEPRRAVVRVVVGGAFGLGLTYAVGRLFGTAVG
jgi:VIT1/CCC1 family predicted Fe2+/Mn2+ transporter